MTDGVELSGASTTGAETDGPSLPTPLVSPLTALDDAVVGEAGGIVALHYGNPGTEERALARGEAFTDYSDRDIVELRGADRLALLEALTSQRIEDIEIRQTRELLILTPQGHIENQALAVDTGESTWLLCDAGYGEAMAEFLTRMRFMMQVEIKPRPDLGALATVVPQVEALSVQENPDTLNPHSAYSTFGAALYGAPDFLPYPLPTWHDLWPRTAAGGATYGPADDRHPAQSNAIVISAVPRDWLMRSARALIRAGLRPAGALAAEALRVVAWRPRMATEGAAAKALPHELDWLRTAVHLNKGCYRGQETVAKVVNLGRPPRRLTMLLLEGEYGELPAGGSEVMWEGRPAGEITSAARSVDDGPVALALLRRAVPADAVLDVGDYCASQRVVVNPGGKSSASPATRPGSELRGRDLPTAKHQNLAGTE